MREPMTFESRLADAFEAYAVGAPIAVDSRELVAGLARRPQARRWELRTWRMQPSRVWRLTLVAALMGLAAIAGLLAAGAFRRPQPLLPSPASRILVWLPSGEGSGIGTELSGDGTVLVSRSMGDRGCPRLIADGELIADPSFGRILIRTTLEGDAVDDLPGSAIDTSTSNLERWSADLRTIAAASIDTGLVTVWHFPANGGPTSESYVLAGSLADTPNVELSRDGSRLATVTSSPGAFAVHVLEHGVDTVVRSIGRSEGDFVQFTISPDGHRLAIATVSPGGQVRFTLVDLRDGTISAPSMPLSIESGSAPLVPVGLWAPDGRSVVLTTGSGLFTYDVEAGTWTDVATSFADGLLDLRWMTDRGGAHVAAIDTSGVLHVFDGRVERQVTLPGGRASTFSPDSSLVLSVGGSHPGRRYVAGEPAQAWLYDVWGQREPQVFTTIPAAGDNVNFDDSLVPCVQWLSGAAS